MRRLSDCDITTSEAFFKILDILQKSAIGIRYGFVGEIQTIESDQIRVFSITYLRLTYLCDLGMISMIPFRLEIQFYPKDILTYYLRLYY
jgi:hypothetical protein